MSSSATRAGSPIISELKEHILMCRTFGYQLTKFTYNRKLFLPVVYVQNPVKDSKDFPTL